MTGNVIADAVNNLPTLTGKSLRLAFGALLSAPSTRPLGGYTGVSPGTPSTIVTATSAQWTVQPHSGVLDVSAAGDGPTPYSFDAAVAGAMQAADGTNPRIDLICVTHNDSNENDNSQGSPAPVITYVPGVPATAGQQQPPATPARSFVLAQVNVPKLNNGNPAVVFVAPSTVAAGGIMPTSGATQYPPNPYVGQYVDDAALGLRRWNGATWGAWPADSGWQACQVASGWAHTTARARKIGSRVSLSIQSSDAYPAELSAFFTLPNGWGPIGSPAGKILVELPGNAGNTGSSVQMQIGATGQVFVARAGAAPVAGIFTHGDVNWLID